MSFDQLNESYIQLVQELNSNDRIQVRTVSYPATTEKVAAETLNKYKLPQSILHYFEAVNGFHLRWENRFQDTTLITGSLILLPAKEATKQWNEAIYFDDNTSAAKSPFYPIDQFSDEACCGIFSGGKNDSLHYYAFSSGEEPYDLQLNIERYITIAIAAKCYYYWPLILKLILEKTESPMIQKMNDDMAVLFPQFNMETWVKEYKGQKRVV